MCPITGDSVNCSCSSFFNVVVSSALACLARGEGCWSCYESVHSELLACQRGRWSQCTQWDYNNSICAHTLHTHTHTHTMTITYNWAKLTTTHQQCIKEVTNNRSYKHIDTTNVECLEHHGVFATALCPTVCKSVRETEKTSVISLLCDHRKAKWVDISHDDE